MTAHQILGRLSQDGGPAARPIESLGEWATAAARSPGVVAICDDGSVRSMAVPEGFDRLSAGLAAEGLPVAWHVVEVQGRGGDCTGGAR
jgi:hypothetical protein